MSFSLDRMPSRHSAFLPLWSFSNLIRGTRQDASRDYVMP